jgi:two-component system, LytTR family, response regulator
VASASPDELAPPPPLRVLIADDEPLARDCIRLALGTESDVEVVAECADGGEAVEAIRRLGPDLVFLDVQMPGLDGFGVVERVGAERMPPIVFVTAYDAHALRAFALHAVDYVLKPFDDRRFREALRHARRQLRLERESELGRRLTALVRDYAALGAEPSLAAPAGGYATRVLVRHGERSVFVATDEIDWFEAAGNYVRLHAGPRTELIRATLASLLLQLDPKRFARIHRSTIVNLSRVREVHPWFGGDYVATLADGQELRVSRSYREALLRPLS